MGIKKYISGFLLSVFLFAITPHEIIHDFTGHYDTVDPISAVTNVSAKHIHCEILQLQLLPFSNSSVSVLPALEAVTDAVSTPPITVFVSPSPIQIATRGPPAC